MEAVVIHETGGPARVIGTGSTRNREFVLSLGADEYVDYTGSEVRRAHELSESGHTRGKDVLTVGA
jgi:NADPH:quinone reductase-like Zn-dependent oxidoreductase